MAASLLLGLLSGYRLGQMLNDLFGKPVDTEQAAAEEAAVLKVVQQFLAAINTNDPERARPILVSKAVFFSIRDKNQAIVVNSVKQFLYRLESRRKAYVERIWEPEISIRNGVATVRASYDLHIDGAFSHCGTYLFNLLKTTEGWKALSITYNMIKMYCPPRSTAY